MATNEAQKVIDAIDDINAGKAARDELREEILEGEEALDVVTEETFRQQDEEDCRACVIAAQAALSHLKDKMIAYNKNYKGLDSKCRIFGWLSSVQGTLDSSTRIAKKGIFENLPAGTTDLELPVDDNIFAIKIAQGGTLGLDTVSMKKLAYADYQMLAKQFPKYSSDRRTVRIYAKKGGN